ncbi:Aste57867_8171 [Aphanomyces stellatus]|uniref:Aste57867_8171 protein n=1 Tax=Aphanomyces stellatus TaxID=120398 RepID=A0A485KJK7_9STRA|nr:hypothetical protein As57867_008141 [Aphanomyces stellatus]VFT85059.1 Aste57867_8171 [Aphanomyces stellatus]
MSNLRIGMLVGITSDSPHGIFESKMRDDEAFSVEQDTRGWMLQWRNLPLPVVHLAVRSVATVITVDDTRTTAAVAVRATSQNLLERIQVRVEPDASALVVEWKTTIGILWGKYIVEVLLPPQALMSVTYAGTDSLVVPPRALRRSPDSPLILRSTATGSLYVDDDDMLVALSLHVQVRKSGRVQLQAPGLRVADSIHFDNQGSGALVAVVPLIATARMDVSNAKSGTCAIVASKTAAIRDALNVVNFGSGVTSVEFGGTVAAPSIMTTAASSGSLHLTCGLCGVSSMRTRLSGSGQICIAGNGVVEHHAIDNTSSGSIYVDGIAATSCIANTHGSGSIYVPPAQHTTSTSIRPRVLAFDGVLAAPRRPSVKRVPSTRPATLFVIGTMFEDDPFVDIPETAAAAAPREISVSMTFETG